jgi:GNAT superfamily N-acetyltransferase
VTHDPAAYRVRPARDRDIRGVMSLLDEASIWLGEKGLDQWQGNRARRETHVATDVAEGTLHVVEHGPLLVATITVDGFADADFWKVEDDVLSSLYAHRMAVARREAGRRLGSAMLDWAGERALACGRTLLRLDAWVTNGALHTYYKNLGFEHVRTEEVADRGSGALFERAATLRLGQGPALVDVPR